MNIAANDGQVYLLSDNKLIRPACSDIFVQPACLQRHLCSTCLQRHLYLLLCNLMGMEVDMEAVTTVCFAHWQHLRYLALMLVAGPLLCDYVEHNDVGLFSTTHYQRWRTIQHYAMEWQHLTEYKPSIMP